MSKTAKKIFWLVLANTGIWGILGFALVIFMLLTGTAKSLNSANADVVGGGQYLKGWSGGDAYHHDFLIQRYGIKAEQIDGYISSLGIKVDERATGKAFLKMQEESGIDVRVLIAFAQAESSFGTAGVAQQFPHANIFGYGAFDSNPNNGATYNNDQAVVAFRHTQIDQYGENTLAILDEAARTHNKPVYWTALDAGKTRATIMETLNKYIDDHGNTPDAPNNGGSQSGTGNVSPGIPSATIPKGYSVSNPQPQNILKPTGDPFPWGQCTWYCWGRLQQLGLSTNIPLGNAETWDDGGWPVSSTPKVHSIVVFAAGQAGAGDVGHVGIVEDVKSDGSILISEANFAGPNAGGLGITDYRIFSANDAKQFHYIQGK